ncbi:MAG: winged helix-turn-helix transcriptional regulator [Chloroflexi bacterium]|nr:winged helix-turn-helix transcriptional regulator [Chloroflexota bacterium]
MNIVTILSKNAEKTELKLAITTKFFRALGDPTRLKVLYSLMEDEKNVGELVGIVGLSQGRVSSHLACLKQCGFVNTRRHGKLVYYSIADDSVRHLLQISQTMIAENAERIWSCTRVDMA